MYFTLLTLLILPALFPLASSGRLVRREAGCVADIYCSPAASDVWIANSTAYQARWNTDYAPFKTAGFVVVELQDIAAPSSHLQLTTYPNAQGYAPITLSDLDFGGPNDSEQYKTRDVRMVIYAQGNTDLVKTPGPTFTIVQPGKNGALPPPKPSTTKPPPTATLTVSTTATAPASPEAANNLPTGALVGIVVGACAAVALLVVGLLFARRRRAPAKQAGAVAGEHKHQSLDSMAPLAAPRVVSAGEDSASLASSARNSGTPTALTQNEAAMIAATYRSLLRKPSWSQSRDAIAEDVSNGGHEERANAILRQELAQEGIDINRVSQGGKVLVHDADKQADS